MTDYPAGIDAAYADGFDDGQREVHGMLKKLIAKWREDAATASAMRSRARHVTFAQCAGELERVLNTRDESRA